MVATIEGAAGMPADFRMAGFTTMMYDMVTKVVTPAATDKTKAKLRWAAREVTAFNGRPISFGITTYN